MARGKGLRLGWRSLFSGLTRRGSLAGGPGPGRTHPPPREVEAQGFRGSVSGRVWFAPVCIRHGVSRSFQLTILQHLKILSLINPSNTIENKHPD